MSSTPLISGRTSSGALVPVQVDSSGAVITTPAVYAGTAPTATTMHNAATASGNGTDLNVTGMPVAIIDIRGTFVASVAFQASANGTNFEAINATKIGSEFISNTATTTGVYRISASGMVKIRAVVTWTSGTSITIVGYPSSVDSHAKIVQTAKQRLTTSTLSNVSASASNVTLLAANTARCDAIFYNDSTSNCRVKFGATASTTSFTAMMTPYSTMSLSDVSSIYTGIIDAIWETATGTMRVTEITP